MVSPERFEHFRSYKPNEICTHNSCQSWQLDKLYRAA